MNKQLALAIQLNTEATLADFCWESNPLLELQLQKMFNHNEERFLYLWGVKGSGKTHLLQGCCQMNNSPESAVYLPLSLLKEWGPEVLEGMEEQSRIAIDDIDVIADNKEWEEALFHLYNRVRDNGKTVMLIAGNQPPSKLPLRLPDLRSRLSWGLVYKLQELSDQQKINTLKSHAQKRGFELSEQVAQFLLNRCARNMHDLHELLNRLDEASLIAQRKITIPFVKATLGL